MFNWNKEFSKKKNNIGLWLTDNLHILMHSRERTKRGKSTCFRVKLRLLSIKNHLTIEQWPMLNLLNRRSKKKRIPMDTHSKYQCNVQHGFFFPSRTERTKKKKKTWWKISARGTLRNVCVCNFFSSIPSNNWIHCTERKKKRSACVIERMHYHGSVLYGIIFFLLSALYRHFCFWHSNNNPFQWISTRHKSSKQSSMKLNAELVSQS